jgi:hypothetical protein
MDGGLRRDHRCLCVEEQGIRITYLLRVLSEQRCPSCTVSPTDLSKVFPHGDTAPRLRRLKKSQELPEGTSFYGDGHLKQIGLDVAVPWLELDCAATDDELLDPDFHPGLHIDEDGVQPSCDDDDYADGDEDAVDEDDGGDEDAVVGDGDGDDDDVDDADDADDGDDESGEDGADAFESALASAGFDVYSMVTVCERLHAFDLGLTKFLVRLLAKYADEAALTARAKSIPHFPGLKYWQNIVGQLSAGHQQGREYRSLLKILVFLSYRLPWKTGVLSVGKKSKYTLPADFSSKFTKCVVLYASFYEACLASEHTEASLSRMETLCRDFRLAWVDHLSGLSPSKLNFVKFHFPEHASRQIRLFGSRDLCNVETMEGFHKLAKAMYQKMNKQVRLLFSIDNLTCRPFIWIHSWQKICTIEAVSRACCIA